MVAKHRIRKRVQQICWAYIRHNFYIRAAGDVQTTAPEIGYDFVPIDADNCSRVVEFRDEDRSRDFRDKLERGEAGYYASIRGELVGSIWSTVNRTASPLIARSYIKLQPGEALVHDIVTGERFRGLGVGPFMVKRIARSLFAADDIRRIVVDVSVRNQSSLRMMAKSGLTPQETMLYLSAFGTLAYQKRLK